ncbi:hypothetical protein PLEOSDRAFT_1091717 [Pleurotus ostreatus PC15]|uniref:ABC transporter domain-containing protein n=1 Tax=Pleurotus ostreatus (strain PC15) TaxID=1137138 RepID=A0A067P423_PLEO1|nr:hypothetical protein PLEOSDRAFT_1091717 [Pleurotus ostreatus PC15]
MTSRPPDARTLFTEDRKTEASARWHENIPPNGVDGHHVDVASAKRSFNELSRQMSGLITKKSQDTMLGGPDVEKAVEEDAEPFDLREYLTSSNDANQAAGIKHKRVGVTWDDLEVKVIGGANSKVGTSTNTIRDFVLSPIIWVLNLLRPLLFPPPPPPTRSIVQKSSGVLKPGEMCLVLGCPGSGCTSFLKAIANQRDEFFSVEGDVKYAGLDAAEMAKYYKGEVVYNQEDDIHIATLTVAQTLQFALSMKSPGPNGRLPGVSRKEFDSEVLNMLLRMLNITHTSKTLVGDEFVRGVSGGERKRVSIAEMMATRARVQCWDNSTRGLDASTALDFVKSLRVMTDILGQTTFVTLYQAGEGIYDLFDKVIVLDEGRQVFYGPPSAARAYFESLGFLSLPRQSTADHLTGCTDPNERQFAPGRSARDVPSTPESLESAYRTSVYALEMNTSRENYKISVETEKHDQEAFRQAVLADKKKGVSKKSPYTLGFWGQVRALTIRELQQRMQDKFQLYTSFALSTILALVIGGAYFGQPPTSNGAFTRGSVIFISLVITCFDAFGEIPMAMLGRPILRKQTNYSMYRPAVVPIANLFSDIPFSALRIFIFDVIVYFMSGLNASGGAFWTFHLINYTAFLTMQGFFRTIGLFCTSFHTAFSGYMISVDSMKRWLFWICTWAGLMENEFMRISLTCDGNSVIPRNILGVDGLGPNQACTLPGAQGGSDVITGESYITAGYALNPADLWKRNFLVGIGFFIVFLSTQLLVIEYFPTFTWEKLNYTVPVPGGTRRLLHDVFGYVKPGSLTALMGASGAGKTTCLDVLAQRKNIGVISGDILVDGRPLGSDFARGTAYAEQMDVHEGTATVREALRFSAYLRQPASVPQVEKDAYVEEIIELLELQNLTEALILSLGVEARKRVTIGVELASKPELLLFLDEPTSGLDAQSAWNLVRFLRKLANQGQAILCTIHQPSSLLFESFDRLLLLERGGETVYFGDIGPDSKVIRDYFAREGAPCPSNANPAEFMLEAIGAGVSARIGSRDWKDIWLDSPEYQKVLQEIEDIKRTALALPVDNETTTSTYATPFWYQLKVVVQRNNLSLWRNPEYIFSRLFACVFISFFISLTFLQLGTSVRDLQYRVFAIFWITLLPALVMAHIEPMFMANRRIFIREASSRIYSPYVFAIGQLVGEIPYNILCAIGYWVLMVFPIGFGQGAAGLDGTGLQLVVLIFMLFFGISFGQLLAAISPSVQVAVLFNPVINLIVSTFCGVTIPYPTMISFWRTWLYELVPYTRTMASTVATELHGLMITCKRDEFAIFDPPSGETCAAWASAFVSVVGGYLDNPDDTSACRYCQFRVGDEFFEPLNIRYSNRWRDVWILFAYFVFNVIATIIASRFLRYAKR